MLTIKKLKKLIKNLPDEAQVNAYEGEASGLQITLNKKSGWIETGFTAEECPNKKHELEEFIDLKGRDD